MPQVYHLLGLIRLEILAPRTRDPTCTPEVLTLNHWTARKPLARDVSIQRFSKMNLNLVTNPLANFRNLIFYHKTLSQDHSKQEIPPKRPLDYCRLSPKNKEGPPRRNSPPHSSQCLSFERSSAWSIRRMVRDTREKLEGQVAKGGQKWLKVLLPSTWLHVPLASVLRVLSPDSLSVPPCVRKLRRASAYGQGAKIHP